MHNTFNLKNCAEQQAWSRQSCKTRVGRGARLGKSCQAEAWSIYPTRIQFSGTNSAFNCFYHRVITPEKFFSCFPSPFSRLLLAHCSLFTGLWNTGKIFREVFRREKLTNAEVGQMGTCLRCAQSHCPWMLFPPLYFSRTQILSLKGRSLS